MNRHPFYLFLALLLSTGGKSFRFSLTPEYPNIKICRSRNVDCKTSLDPNIQLRYYRRQYSECTHILGNLVLCNLRRYDNGSDPDLSFLTSIVEVSGYVYISNNDVRRIPLTSLRIIRGMVPYYIPSLGNSALVISRNAFNKTVGLEVLDLRKLTVIQNHNVALWDNPQLCYIAFRVDFHALFPNPKQQEALRVSNSDLISQSGCDFDNTSCHPSCVQTDTNAYCWGPEKDQCQLRSKCLHDTSRYCLMDGYNLGTTCDDACIGGCTGHSSNCWACRDKLNNRTCTGSCPPKYILSHVTSRQELNPEFKYDLHDICVKTCPAPFLKMDTVCVIECDFKTTIPINGSCEPCATSPCAEHCTKEQIFGTNFPLITSAAAEKMKTCEYYSGPIYLNRMAFEKRGSGPAPLARLDDLWNLRNLREIVGYIYLDFTGSPPELTNLTFLQNLYKVTAEFSDGVSLGIALSIYNASNLEFLGFKSLRYVDTDAYLEFLPSLCYLSGLKQILPMRTKAVKSPTTCDNEGHVCHSECLPITGCWGPGPAMCAHCCGFQAGDVCVSSCLDEPGFYTPPGLETQLVSVGASGSPFSSLQNAANIQCPTLPLTAAQLATMTAEEAISRVIPSPACARCHVECAQTCFNASNIACIGPCKHYKEANACVSNCSRNYYADETTKDCLLCHPTCSNALQSTPLPVSVAACSGPGSYLGNGGCTFCHFIRKNPETQRFECLDRGCPPSHYGRPTHLSELKIAHVNLSPDNLHAATLDIRECAPCHPLCEVCEGPSTHETVCLKCRGWIYKGECVETCPSDDTYMPNENATLNEQELAALKAKQCLLCHRQCAGGCYAAGPEDCVNCRFRKILIDEESNKFVCNSTCPPDQPFTMPNTNLCLDKIKYELISGAAATRTRNRILLGCSLGLFGVFLLALLIIVPCFHYKAKRRKIREALKSVYTNKAAPDMKSQAASREPNMGRLEIINSDDLQFDESSTPLGTGAFGAVYRGKWRVPKRILAEYNWPRSTNLDVAVKVIRSPAEPVRGTVSGKAATMEPSDTSPEAKVMERIAEKNNLNEMLSEAKVMASVSHLNCLPLIGVCLTKNMQCMVSAFVELGSIDRYLRENKDSLNSYTLLSWAEQIADGMAYLEARGIIHRDLAARNVLLQSPEHVQITDFGLAKMLDSLDENSVVVRSGRVPIRWLAIETLQFGIYSHKTDVWSYGVTLWEIFTFGKQPYENIETVDIKDHVMKGGRLTQPDICTLDAYMVMVKCWMEDYDSRPTFLELMRLFHDFCQTPGRYLYIQGDEFAIDRVTQYTPFLSSPAPWSDFHEMRQVPTALRGVPDGNASAGCKFKFSEGSTDDMGHISGVDGPGRPRPMVRLASGETGEEEDKEDADQEALLPMRSGNGSTLHPRHQPGGQSASSVDTRSRDSAASSVSGLTRMWRRPQVTPSESIGSPTSRTGNGALPSTETSSPLIGEFHGNPSSRFYYNTSGFSPSVRTPQQNSGVYGRWVGQEAGSGVRPCPTGASRLETDDDYVPGIAPPEMPTSQLSQEDYLEPRVPDYSAISSSASQPLVARTRGDGARPVATVLPAFDSVTNPRYYAESTDLMLGQDYLQPSVPGAKHPGENART
uniref:receptor protein-tyrosine kinase n=1 Tax=Schistocephalus solidus TaxID=70667 RepID=A0A0X3PH98_SCHSO